MESKKFWYADDLMTVVDVKRKSNLSTERHQSGGEPLQPKLTDFNTALSSAKTTYQSSVCEPT